MGQMRITKIKYIAYHISAEQNTLAERNIMFHTSIQKLNISESQRLEVSVPSSDMHDHILIGWTNRLN